MKTALRVMAALALIAASAAVNDTSHPLSRVSLDASATTSKSLDLKVALLGPGGCGQLTDNLPTLFAVSTMTPGQQTPTIEICLRNNSGSAATLVMRSIDRVDTDTACTGDEPLFDKTCGNNQQGEAGPNVQHLISTDPRCNRSLTALATTGFATLESSGVVLSKTLKAKTTICAAITLRYQPPTATAQIVGQSDTVTWRYAFDLSS